MSTSIITQLLPQILLSQKEFASCCPGMLLQNVEPSKCEYEFAVSVNDRWDGIFDIQVDLTLTLSVNDTLIVDHNDTEKVYH